MQTLKIVSVSLGIDHSLFLASNGLVFSCGLNDNGQLGLKDTKQASSPTLVNSSKSKLPYARGILAAKFHSLFWTHTELYTWGLNGGQLGHIKKDWTIAYPKLVASVKDVNLDCVATSDGAIVILNRNGDLKAIHEYQTRHVASRLTDVVKIEVIGGHLDPKAVDKASIHLVERGGQDLKIFILNKIGRISVWTEKSPSMNQCLFNVTKELWITDFVLHRHGMLLTSKEGFAYQGVHHAKVREKENSSKASNSSVGGSLFKFIDKSACDVIKVRRVSYVHRAQSVACDPKGRNFCVLQTDPMHNLNELPCVSPKTIAKDVKAIYDEDHLKDLVLKVGKASFRCHKIIVSTASDKLAKLVKLVDNTDDSTVIIEEAIAPELFEQILQYAYSQGCDLTSVGRTTFKWNPKKEQCQALDEINSHFE